MESKKGGANSQEEIPLEIVVFWVPCRVAPLAGPSSLGFWFCVRWLLVGPDGRNERAQRPRSIPDQLRSLGSTGFDWATPYTGLLKRYILQPFETWLFPPKYRETTI